MKTPQIILLLVIIAASHASLKDNLTVCPNQASAVSLMANTTLNYPSRFLTMQIKTKRLPATGMFDRDITCIQALDTSSSQSSGTVELIEGGLSQRYAVLRFRSHIGGSLNYVLQAYSQL